VDGKPAKDLGRRLRAGIQLADGPVTADSFKLVEQHAGRSLIELVLHEGRKHIVRRMLDEVGHPVRRLVRIQIGEVRLGNAKPGNLRPLNHREIGALYAAVEM
jgi:23S rRNA pseudouridine2605 synthase